MIHSDYLGVHFIAVTKECWRNQELNFKEEEIRKKMIISVLRPSKGFQFDKLMGSQSPPPPVKSCTSEICLIMQNYDSYKCLRLGGCQSFLRRVCVTNQRVHNSHSILSFYFMIKWNIVRRKNVVLICRSKGWKMARISQEPIGIVGLKFWQCSRIFKIFHSPTGE